MAEDEFTVLSVSGHNKSGELKEFQNAIGAEAANRSLVLDLGNLRLVSHAVVAFLSQCEDQGIRLRNCPAYIRSWIVADRVAREFAIE